MDDFSEKEIEEEGEENEADFQTSENEFQQAVTWGADWTVETILSQLRKGNIDLNPSFQRRNAWFDDRKSKFIESLMLGLPIPEIVLAESKTNKGQYIVIDGKQRLLTIRQFCADKKDKPFEPFRLKGLKIHTELNGKKYSDLTERGELTSFRRIFDNQTLRTIIIKNWPNENYLYTVFLRINTGSVQLSPQELRQALHPGKFLENIDKVSQESKIIQQMLHMKKPDPRMRDIEIIIRYLSFVNYSPKYDGALKRFLDNVCKDLNLKWDMEKDQILNQVKQLEESIVFTKRIFGQNNAFSKWVDGAYQQKFNRAVYDIMTYYFSNPMIREAAEKRSSQIKKRFEDVCAGDPEFLSSIERTTKSLDNTDKRFRTWGKILETELAMPISVPEFNKEPWPR